MIHSGIGVIQSFLATYGIATAFLVGFGEEILFFVPSTGFFIALGFFLVNPHAYFWQALAQAFSTVGLLSSLGVLVGGWIMYGIVYFGGKPLVMQFGAYVRLRWQDIERFYDLLERRGASIPALLFIRVIPAFPIGIMSIVCGLMRVRLWEFTWTTFLGSIVRTTFLSMVGWYVGKEYAVYAEQIAGYERYFVALVVFALFVALLIHFKNKKRRS